MSKIEIDYKNQLEENIKIHRDMLDISADVIEIIQNIKKIKKGR